MHQMQPPQGNPQPNEPKKKRSKKKGGPTPGRRNAVIAGVFAVVVLLAVLVSTGGSEAGTWVLRARVPVNALEQVQEGMLEAVELPPEAVEPDAISGESAEDVLAAARGEGDNPEDAVVGEYPVYPIREGQQISPAMFTSEGLNNVTLEPNERLLSISADAAAAVAGTLKAGDLVDVVSVNTGDDTAGVVAPAVEIVSIQVPSRELDSASQLQSSEDGRDLSAEDILPRDPIPGTYVVIADVKTAAALTVADQVGPLYLLYRAPGAETAAVGNVSLAEAICSSGSPDGAPIAGCSVGVVGGGVAGAPGGTTSTATDVTDGTE